LEVIGKCYCDNVDGGGKQGGIVKRKKKKKEKCCRVEDI